MLRRTIVVALAVFSTSSLPGAAFAGETGGPSAPNSSSSRSADAGQAQHNEYRLLATLRTGTMQKELDEAAAAGYRFMGVMKGDTAFGGDEVVSILAREAGSSTPRYEYKLLATTKTSTMQKELQEAGDQGFEYRGQTVNGEVLVILEHELAAPIVKYEYRLLATNKTGTMQKELVEAGDQGFEFVGVTVAETAFGGSEIVTILRRRVE